MKHQKFLLVVLALALLSLACALPFSIGGDELEALPDLIQIEDPEESVMDTFLESVSNEPNPNPVSINRGLSTLNAYRLIGEMEMIGPTSEEIVRIQVAQEYDQNLDASLRTMTSYEKSLEYPDSEASTMYMWRVGNDSCNWTEGSEEYEFSSLEPELREVSDLITDVFDMVLLIENPQFVGEEVMNGIVCNHFQFQLSGLGVTSGATVISNQGEYWLAKDGDYLVKYYLLTETSTSPEKINHLEVTMDLTEVNLPRSISMPQSCYDAQFNE